METNDYEKTFNKIKDMLQEQGLVCRSRFMKRLYPSLQNLWIDMLKKEDWPGGIYENSMFLSFQIDLNHKTVEIRLYGHIYLTEEDKEKSYLEMCSVKNAIVKTGGKWFRKQKWTNEEVLVEKITDFYKYAVETLNKVAGGYPYKQMTVNIY